MFWLFNASFLWQEILTLQIYSNFITANCSKLNAFPFPKQYYGNQILIHYCARHFRGLNMTTVCPQNAGKASNISYFH